MKIGKGVSSLCRVHAVSCRFNCLELVSGCSCCSSEANLRIEEKPLKCNVSHKLQLYLMHFGKHKQRRKASIQRHSLYTPQHIKRPKVLVLIRRDLNMCRVFNRSISCNIMSWYYHDTNLKFIFRACMYNVHCTCIKMAGHYVSSGDHTCPRLASAQVTWTPN